jgi:hypothetical protein
MQLKHALTKHSQLLRLSCSVLNPAIKIPLKLNESRKFFTCKELSEKEMNE